MRIWGLCISLFPAFIPYLKHIPFSKLLSLNKVVLYWKFLKMLRVTVWHSNSTPKYLLKRNENKCPHKNLYTNLHDYSQIIHNSQKWKQSKCPLTGKQITQYTCTQWNIFFSNRKAWSIDTYDNMDMMLQLKIYILYNVKEASHKRLYMLCDTIHMKCPE